MKTALPLLLILAFASPASAAPARPAKLGLCTACHGDDGRSRVPGIPHLGGQDETYLANTLAAFRDGRRQGPPMNAIANTLQPADIAALARWYASRPAASKP